jgi:hypothetical protein
VKVPSVIKVVAKAKQHSLAETAANSASLVQKSDVNLSEAKGNDIIPKIASVITGPGPAATAVGNPRPTAAIAKPIIKKKDSAKPAPAAAPAAAPVTAPAAASPAESNSTAPT